MTITLTGTVDPTATGTLTNTATVSPPAGVTDPNLANNSASDTDTLTPQADLAIAKGDGVTSVVPGTSITYAIVVSNNGPSAVTGASVSDPLPADVTSATWTTTAARAGLILGLVDPQRPSTQILTVEALDRTGGIGLIHFHKRKSARPAGLAVRRQRDGLHLAML